MLGTVTATGTGRGQLTVSRIIMVAIAANAVARRGSVIRHVATPTSGHDINEEGMAVSG